MANSVPRYDVIIVGAGVCGVYMLHKMRALGLDALVLEAGDDLGGTWYWNRYPGARFDSESYSYGYSADPEILAEWSWSEHFAPQPETLRYLNFVADKWNLRDGMRFGTRVAAARFVDDADVWEIELDSGERYRARWFCTAVGMLSAATLPRIPGVERFEGPSFHTYYWPKEEVALEGKRVAVIGTGATGVQVIGAIADKVGSLSVFQRRPNWCAPLHNRPISPEEMEEIRANYDEIFEQCRSTPNAFLHGPNRESMHDVPRERRLEFWEQLYDSPGFGVWLGNYREVFMSPEANAEYSAFIADKIRERVDDPETAEKLIPKDHGFGTRRVPLETRYYEAYNRDNVRLVDLNETPIETIDETGIQTRAEHFDVDLIIYATGFDAITGAYDRMDIRGADGASLKDKWRDGPRTYLGLQVHGFPNLFTLAGPQSASVSTNFPRAIEDAVDWTADFLGWLRDNGHTRVEPTRQAEREWTEHVASFYEGSMIGETKSWFTGYNSNVDGHDRIRHMIYLGGAPTYRERLGEVAGAGYEGFRIDGG